MRWKAVRHRGRWVEELLVLSGSFSVLGFSLVDWNVTLSVKWREDSFLLTPLLCAHDSSSWHGNGFLFTDTCFGLGYSYAEWGEVSLLLSSVLDAYDWTRWNGSRVLSSWFAETGRRSFRRDESGALERYVIDFGFVSRVAWVCRRLCVKDGKRQW